MSTSFPLTFFHFFFTLNSKGSANKGFLKLMLKTSGVSELSDIFSKPTNTKMEGIISAYEAGTIVGGMV